MSEAKAADGSGSKIAGIFCLLASLLGGSSLAEKVEHFNGWQAAGYAVIAGVFIAIVTLAISSVVSSLEEN